MDKIRPVITWNDIWIWIIDPKFQGLDYKGLEFGGLKPGDLEPIGLEFESLVSNPSVLDSKRGLGGSEPKTS